MLAANQEIAHSGPILTCVKIVKKNREDHSGKIRKRETKEVMYHEIPSVSAIRDALAIKFQ